MPKIFIYLLGILVGFAALQVAGPIGLLIVIIGIIGYWRYTVTRGVLFIQAYCYLAMLGNGMTAQDANMEIIKMSKAELSGHVDTAFHAANDLYGGSQTSVINAARNMGFVK